MPSPTMATTFPPRRSVVISSALSAGIMSEKCRVRPIRVPIARATVALSPVIITVSRMPMRCSVRTTSRLSGRSLSA